MLKCAIVFTALVIGACVVLFGLFEGGFTLYNLLIG
jgi:multisubunit Na+/H+ antiporter MnhC subunit